MPIPNFNSDSVIPPHLGDPRQPDELSPYPCTSLELCDRFGTSHTRIEILHGFMRLRAELHQHGMSDGFQWIDGSFLEDVEHTQQRAPGDIDVVTFFWSNDPNFVADLLIAFPDIRDHAKIKTTFHVDHFPIDAGYNPEATIEATRYWCGLFSHNRSAIWKGMLRIELNTPADDTQAVALLNQRQIP